MTKGSKTGPRKYDQKGDQAYRDNKFWQKRRKKEESKDG